MHLPVSSLKLLLDVNCVGWSCWNFLLAVPAEAFAVVRVRRRWNDWLEKAQVTTFGKVRYRCHFPPLLLLSGPLKLWKSLHFLFMASVRKSGKPSNSSSSQQQAKTASKNSSHVSRVLRCPQSRSLVLHVRSSTPIEGRGKRTATCACTI